MAENKPKPTNPKLYATVKAMAKRKFKVYPSAYANAWLVRTYKKKGGGYKKCGRSKLEKDRKRKYPKCVPAAKAARMSKSQIKSAVTRKRAKKQGVGGKPTNVKTFAASGGKITKRSNMGLFGRI